MIETKEEYAQTWALINGQDRQVAKDFHETIEALREVARASEDLMNWHDGPLGRGPALDSAKARLRRSLDALSNWLKDG